MPKLAPPLPDFLRDDGHGYVNLAGHRVGLIDIVFYYNEGYSPEMLVCQFPTLPLALVHKVIAFYLENQDAVDAYAKEHQEEVERQRATAPRRGPGAAELRARLEKKRQAKAS